MNTAPTGIMRAMLWAPENDNEAPRCLRPRSRRPQHSQALPALLGLWWMCRANLASPSLGWGGIWVGTASGEDLFSNSGSHDPRVGTGYRVLTQKALSWISPSHSTCWMVLGTLSSPLTNSNSVRRLSSQATPTQLTGHKLGPKPAKDSD